MAHKSQSELAQDIEKAKEHIEIGGIYVHFKSPTMRYQVTDLAIDVDDSSVCVIYRALYDQQVLFVRSLKEWLDDVDVDGVRVKRFALIGD
jgi:hypothetical protein